MKPDPRPAITLDETFDLERDDTCEVAVPEPVDDEDEPTRPYQVAPRPLPSRHLCRREQHARK